MKTALIVIDLLQDFFKEGLLAEHRKQLVTSVNELIDAAHAKNIPVIWVRQEYKADLSDAPLYDRKQGRSITIEGTEGCKLLPELHRNTHDHEIIKKRYSVFYKTSLEGLLDTLGIDTLIVTGINTMTCIRTSCVDAYQRDYHVILALDCVDAYDPEQHSNSIQYLQYAIAQGKHNDEILKDIL